MPYLVISPLSRIAAVAAEHGAREMISIVGRGQAVDRPAAIDARRHLTIDVNDVVVAADGLIVPQEEHVEHLLRFAGAWDRHAPLVVHCWMGISRSPAAALLIALSLHPDQDDDHLARRMRDASPFSTPNARIVEIGDAMLGRTGRLVRAVRAMGRGADAFEGRPFVLSLRPNGPRRADTPDA